MKNFNSLLIMFCLMAGLVPTLTVQAKSTEQTQNKNQSVILDIQNMTCAMCPITIRKALQGVDGVQSAKVDFTRKSANVTFNPKKTNIEALIKTTTNAGYPATVHTEK